MLLAMKFSSRKILVISHRFEPFLRVFYLYHFLDILHIKFNFSLTPKLIQRMFFWRGKTLAFSSIFIFICSTFTALFLRNKLIFSDMANIYKFPPSLPDLS